MAWLALMLALWLWGHDTVEDPITAVPKTGDVAATGHPPAPGLPPVHEPLPGAGPQTLAIKALGLKAPIEPHGLDALGGVEPPPYERPNTVAWYQNGPPPGSTGAAVLVGHVDTKSSPAVFYELSNVKRGAKIDVTRNDGSVAEFTVENVATVENNHFDADKVYGAADTKRAELRLITCGGEYDRAHREYKANVVVTAYLTGTRQTAPDSGGTAGSSKPPAPSPSPALTPAPSGTPEGDEGGQGGQEEEEN
ncbi:class F sortase [Streptomyces cinnamoneus]|uniref:class F sortase n=1 Tax=Streptomyces cinnamoneus TaxID=53446 RepID=UPI0030B8822B